MSVLCTPVDSSPCMCVHTAAAAAELERNPPRQVLSRASPACCIMLKGRIDIFSFSPSFFHSILYRRRRSVGRSDPTCACRRHEEVVFAQKPLGPKPNPTQNTHTNQYDLPTSRTRQSPRSHIIQYNVCVYMYIQ